MSRREPGRAVIPHHARDEKAIVQPKVGPAEKRREPAFRRVGRGRSRGGGIEAVEAVGVGEESDAPSHHPVRLELAVFVATHDVEAVTFAVRPCTTSNSASAFPRVLVVWPRFMT